MTNPHVLVETRRLTEPFAANATRVRSVTFVHVQNMDAQTIAFLERSGTKRAEFEFKIPTERRIDAARTCCREYTETCGRPDPRSACTSGVCRGSIHTRRPCRIARTCILPHLKEDPHLVNEINYATSPALQSVLP